MNSCNRSRAFGLGDGYSLLFFEDGYMQEPTPKARDFELPGDSVQYAPDRPADVKHVKLEITLDFEHETISGTAYTTFSALYEEVKTIIFDAVELHVERVTLDGAEQEFSTKARSCL